MTAGITVYNAYGALQISSEFRCLSYIGKGTINVGAKEESRYHYITPQTVASFNADEVIAFRCENSFFGIASTPQMSGNQQIMRVCCQAEWETITYYRFKETKCPPGKYFEIYGEHGELIFSDTIKPMRVLAGRAGIFPNPDGTLIRDIDGKMIESLSINDTTKIAAIVMGQPTFALAFGNQTIDVYAGGQMWNTPLNHISTGVGCFRTYGNSGALLAAVRQNYSYLIIDVTGL